MVRAASMAGVAFLALAVTAGGCGSSSGNTGTAGSTGTAGTTGAAGTTGSAGTTGTAGVTGAGGSSFPTDCSALASASTSMALGSCTSTAPGCLLDFDAGTHDFGDFDTTGMQLSGGTFIYSGSSSPGLTEDFTGMTWHITGSVGDYSGLGIYIQCGKANLSAFQGIQFDIGGTFTSGGDGGVPGTGVTVTIGTPADSVATAYTGDVTVPVWGTCMPASCQTGCNQYDGTCASPSKTITFGATPATVMVKWTDLTGGKPNAGLDPTQIMGISFVLPWSGAGAPYNVDITLDNIMLY